MDAYVVGTSTLVDFKLPEDEFHSHWTAEGTRARRILPKYDAARLTVSEITFLPQAEQGSIKLLDRKTFSIIDQ